MPDDKAKNMPTVELDADMTDTVADQSVTAEEWYPHFKVLTKQNGEVKFKLYQHCPCSLSIRFEFETQGVALIRDTSKCDLCTSQDQDNAERIGAVMDGFRVVSDKVMELGKAQEVFADAVKAHVGRDLRKEGATVGVRKEGSEPLVSLEQAEEVRSDAQILLVCALELVDSIDINSLEPNKREEYLAVVRMVESIKGKPAFVEPTDKVRSVLEKLKATKEQVIDKVMQEMPDADEGDIVNLLIEQLKNKRNDKENLS
jgi:hypothetical protein